VSSRTAASSPPRYPGGSAERRMCLEDTKKYSIASGASSRSGADGGGHGPVIALIGHIYTAYGHTPWVLIKWAALLFLRESGSRRGAECMYVKRCCHCRTWKSPLFLFEIAVESLVCTLCFVATYFAVRADAGLCFGRVWAFSPPFLRVPY
jgi:hypothetical protein